MMKYFTIKELCNSATAKAKGIDNTPTSEVEANLTLLVDNVLDPLREAYGKPIRVSSGYRSPKLNSAVGGVKTSQHRLGQAADITVDNRVENMKLFNLVQSLKLPYCQLIFEKGDTKVGPDWVHVSYDKNNIKRQIVYLK
jgi:hypothetical protein